MNKTLSNEPYRLRPAFQICLAELRVNILKYIVMTCLLFGLIHINMINILFSWMLVSMSMKMDLNYGVEKMYCSLPVKRSHVVLGQWLTAIVVIGGGLLLALISDLIFGMKWPSKKIINDTFNIPFLSLDILTVLFPLFIVLSIYFVLFYRMKSRNNLNMTVYLLSFIPVVVWIFVLSVFIGIKTGDWLPVVRIWETSHWFFFFPRFVLISKYILGNFLFSLSMIIIILPMFLASIALSIKAYSKRDL